LHCRRRGRLASHQQARQIVSGAGDVRDDGGARGFGIAGPERFESRPVAGHRVLGMLRPWQRQANEGSDPEPQAFDHRQQQLGAGSAVNDAVEPPVGGEVAVEVVGGDRLLHGGTKPFKAGHFGLAHQRGCLHCRQAFERQTDVAQLAQV
jgi:hypothetical protein